MTTTFSTLEKLSKATMMLALTLFVFTACNDDDLNVDAVVEFQDAELREIIQENLNLATGTVITESMLANLTELDINNSLVVNLSGLDKAKNLEVLLARNTEIQDMSPLADLENIKEIDMRDAILPGNDKLGFMTKWNNIERINFQKVVLSNISVLAGKTSLTHINLRETNVSDISALEGMTQLLFLNLNRAGGGDGITNPAITIPMNKLYYLSLRNTTLGDNMFAQIFANKDQLVEVNIRNTGITSIQPLVASFQAGAFTQTLSDKYGNKISLDLQNNSIEDYCLMSPWVSNFPEGELEWSGSFSFDQCAD